MDLELDLMKRVRRLAGPYLDTFAPSSSIPIAFWAALTAGESGAWLIHDTRIPPRLEPTILTKLIDVALGRKLRYGQLTTAMLEQLEPSDLKPLASSYGFTQILGYNTLLWGMVIADLDNPATHYPLAARLMADFVTQFDLDNTKDFAEMGQCWNAGSVDAPTLSPDYVPNLLKRMAIWEGL